MQVNKRQNIQKVFCNPFIEMINHKSFGNGALFLRKSIKKKNQQNKTKEISPRLPKAGENSAGNFIAKNWNA